ncbi:hypothetical protein ULG90_08345 [Halopseudomonas pachastrellae]|nr:hypothetical protein ULG90_08345 [Halopseudomonas pachastrellae]
MAISDTGCPSPRSDNRPARLAVITPATPINPIRPIWLSRKPKGGADSSSAMARKQRADRAEYQAAKQGAAAQPWVLCRPA